MIKKFIAVAAFAIAMAVTVSASAATFDFGSTTIKKGSMGPYARNVQAALNACNGANLVVDGNFGSMSVAAAKAFQTLKGLPADGLVGNMTKVALNNCGTPAVPTTPSAGLCPNGMTLASNCTLSPSGVPTNNSSAPLSINNVSAVSGNLNTSVGVGQVDKPIANIRMVTGAGGAAQLTGLNLSFYNFGSGTDYQFTKYASNVGVWLNGVKVGSLDAGQFAQYNSVYSAYVPVSGAQLTANSTNNIVISVTALPVIDSNNMSGDVWGLDVTSIRYSDATGVFTYTPSNIFGNVPLSGTTYSSSNTYFSFASAASAQSIKLTVTKNLSDSNDSVVSGSASANTNGVQLAKIDLNAQGSTINVRRLPVTLTVGASATVPSAVVNTLRLYDASGVQLDSQAVASGYGSQTITFQNLNLNVATGTTTTLTIKGDFNTVGSANFPAGEYAQVSVASGDVSNIQAYDSGSNVLSGSTYLTGSTTGSKVYVYVNGISVSSTGMATTNVGNPGGANTHTFVTYTIPFSVTAFGSTAYVPTVAAAATTASAAQAIQFCIDATTACAAAGSGTVYYTGNDTITTANGNFQVPVGQTKNFQLVVTYQPASAITTRATLINVNWSASDATAYTGSWNTYTAGLNSNAFKTQPQGAY